MSRRPSDFCHICLLAHAGSESFSVMQICYDLKVELSLGKCIHQLKLRKFCYVLNKRLCDGFIEKTIKESFRMKKCISFRAAGSPSQNVVEGLCLQSSSPTAKQSQYRVLDPSLLRTSNRWRSRDKSFASRLRFTTCVFNVGRQGFTYVIYLKAFSVLFLFYPT